MYTEKKRAPGGTVPLGVLDTSDSKSDTEVKTVVADQAELVIFR
jgi:hypothetical protein